MNRLGIAIVATLFYTLSGWAAAQANLGAAPGSCDKVV